MNVPLLFSTVRCFTGLQNTASARFKAFWHCLTLEDGTARLSRNVGTCATSQKSEDLTKEFSCSSVMAVVADAGWCSSSTMLTGTVRLHSVVAVRYVWQLLVDVSGQPSRPIAGVALDRLAVLTTKECDLGIFRRRWENNITMDIQAVGWGGVDWINLAEVASACECGDEPSGSVNVGIS